MYELLLRCLSQRFENLPATAPAARRCYMCFLVVFSTYSRLVRNSEAKRRALTEFTLNHYLPPVRLNELLDNGKAESHSAFLVRISL